MEYSQPSRTFHSLPLLPTEIQIQIWLAAASIPRVVVMAPHTAHDRSYQWLARDHLDNSSVSGKVPVLLHTSHLARKLCLPIYKHRFKIAGCAPDLWETYLLADHDVLCLSNAALNHLVGGCVLRDDRDHRGIDPDDMSLWTLLREAAERGRLDRRFFETHVTTSIYDLIERSMAPPAIPCLRDDLAVLKRVLFYMDHVERQWPGLLRDPDLLYSLERAAELITTPLATARPPWLATGAGIRELPPRYRCRPAHCPHHPGTCDLARPSAAVTKTHQDLSLWLNEHAHSRRDRVVSEALHKALAGHLGYRSLVLWHFAEPYQSPTPTTPLDSISERYIDQFCALVCRASPWRATVYEEHTNWAHVCKWAWPGAAITYYGSRRPGKRTPRCSVWAHWR